MTRAAHKRLLGGLLITGALTMAGPLQAQTASPATTPTPAPAARDDNTVSGVTVTAKKPKRILQKPGTEARKSATCEYLVATDPLLRAQVEAAGNVMPDPSFRAMFAPTFYLPTRAPRTPDYSAPPKRPVGSALPAVKPTWRGLRFTTSGFDASQDVWSDAETGDLVDAGEDNPLDKATKLCKGMYASSFTVPERLYEDDTTLPTAFALFDEGRYAEALVWFKAAHKKLGDDEAALTIGKILLFGLGDKGDAREALAWLEKAAGARFDSRIHMPIFDPKEPDRNTAIGEAALLLGKIHLTGFGNVSKNPETAVKWFRRASEVGHVPAAKTLGDIYFLGKDLPRDPKKALGYYKQAATLGHAPAQYALAEIVRRGEAGPADEQTAMAWYNQAAKLEHPDALYALALAYDTGEGVPADPQKAVGLYKSAALAGHAAAQCAMGTYFYEGKLLAKDDATARKWFEQAAVAGDPDGMFNLGVMLMKGEGGPADRVKAWVWFKLADRLKKENVAVALKALERGMTAAERQAAAQILEPKKAG